MAVYRAGFLIALLVTVAGSAWGDGVAELRQCEQAMREGWVQESNWPYAPCSRAILSGGLSDEELAHALTLRGLFFYSEGHDVLAVDDLDRAISLNATDAESFYYRGKGESPWPGWPGR